MEEGEQDELSFHVAVSKHSSAVNVAPENQQQDDAPKKTLVVQKIPSNNQELDGVRRLHRRAHTPIPSAWQAAYEVAAHPFSGASLDNGEIPNYVVDEASQLEAPKFQNNGKNT